MTHEELLAKIDAMDGILYIHNETIAGMGKGDKALLALRAVVELHKPIEENGKLWCSHEDCYDHIEFLERDNCTCDYPCPTIQAIEKELK